MLPRFFEKFLVKLTEFGPQLVATMTFLPCGLLMGFTSALLVIERDNLDFKLIFGSFILAIACAIITAMILSMQKVFKGRVSFWHFDILIIALIINFIGSGFFFSHNLNIVGAYLSFVGYSLIYITTLSYLHIVSSKSTRSIFLSSCFAWYFFGIASAISLIANSREHILSNNENLLDSNSTINNNTTNNSDNSSAVYSDFAGLNIACSFLVLSLLIGIKILDRFGNVEYKNIYDNELRIANSNGTIFDKRDDIIRRVHFFYVTKSRQWRVSFILIFTNLICFGIFTYFMFWFSLNDSVRLTKDIDFGLIFWTICAGCIVGTITMIFLSNKVIFLISATAHVFFSIIGIIIFGTVGSLVPFWFNCFLFGITLACLGIALLETSHLKYIELITFLSLITQFIAIATIHIYFVADGKNSFFYSQEKSTLVAHGITFVIIMSLLAVLVSLQIPRTYRTSLFNIQYELMGIIFTKHQIEKLNVNCLKDGTIPTISGRTSTTTSSL